MTRREEIKNTVALVYGKDSEITKGFFALCDLDGEDMIPDAHLKFILFYIGCDPLTVIEKKQELKNKED